MIHSYKVVTESEWRPSPPILFYCSIFLVGPSIIRAVNNRAFLRIKDTLSHLTYHEMLINMHPQLSLTGPVSHGASCMVEIKG